MHEAGSARGPDGRTESPPNKKQRVDKSLTAADCGIPELDDDAMQRAARIASAWSVSDPHVRGKIAISNMNRVRDRVGRIYDATSKGGYRMVRVGDRDWRLHVLVYWLTHGDTVHQIERIDGDRGNSRPENLRERTPSHKQIHTPHSKTRTIPVVGTKDDISREFESAASAALALGLDSHSIRACCRGTQRRTGGWAFAHTVQPDLPDEVWRPISGIQVSNMGRAWTKVCGKHFPIPRYSGYCAVRAQDQSVLLLHRLCCQAFHGHPTAINSVVDHKDGDPTNNKATNLEWVSNQANAAKAVHLSSKVTRRSVVVTSADKSVTYSSVGDACIGEGLIPVTLCELCVSGNSLGGRVFSYSVNHPFPGEVFRNIDPREIAHLRKPSYEILELI